MSAMGRAYVWECRADAAGRVEAMLRARISVGSRCGRMAVLCDSDKSLAHSLADVYHPFVPCRSVIL